jgi:hypothetical protein
MTFPENGLVLRHVREYLRQQYSVITEINRKYATPRITMSRGVKLSLLFLRLYLLFLVILLGYKFLTMLSGG